MAEIVQLNADEARAELPVLMELLRDGVAGGASLGFWHPIPDDLNESFWHDMIAEVAAGKRILLVAKQDGQIVGTGQLVPSSRPNGIHRAEIQKLLVHSSARRQGLGRLLITALEDAARRDNRSLVFLDTLRGQPAETFYRDLGYQEAGAIPRYTIEADHTYHATVIFYRFLEE